MAISENAWMETASCLGFKRFQNVPKAILKTVKSWKMQDELLIWSLESRYRKKELIDGVKREKLGM
jgi:hypothetical protein